jgi:hypothetical protein
LSIANIICYVIGTWFSLSFMFQAAKKGEAFKLLIFWLCSVWLVACIFFEIKGWDYLDVIKK